MISYGVILTLSMAIFSIYRYYKLTKEIYLMNLMLTMILNHKINEESTLFMLKNIKKD